MRAFDVFLLERNDNEGATGFTKTWIDTVFFDSDIPCPGVKRSLVEHDGYPPNIYVSRRRKN